MGHFLSKTVQKQREETYDRRRRNLMELVERYGSRRALALSIAMSPQQIGDILNKRCGFGDKVAERIENQLQLEPGHLDKEPPPPGAFDLPEKKETFEKTEMPGRRIPLISFVQAGRMTGVGDLTSDEYVICYGDASPTAFALRVKGDSMTPVFDEDDIVIVDDQRSPSVGDYVVARSELDALEEATIKRYYVTGYDEHGREVFELRPLNPNYPVMDSQQLKLKVIGVVVELVKRF